MKGIVKGLQNIWNNPSNMRDKHVPLPPLLLKDTYSKEDLLPPIPSIRKVPFTDQLQLILYKLRLCCVLFEWERENEDAQAKDGKRQQLLELFRFMEKKDSMLAKTANHDHEIEAVASELLKMVSIHVSQRVSQIDRTNDSNSSEEERKKRTRDQPWYHLELVYKLFVCFMDESHLDYPVLKRYIGHPFIVDLMKILESENPNEREHLKIMLHRTYASMGPLRTFLRNTFCEFLRKSTITDGEEVKEYDSKESLLSTSSAPTKTNKKRFYGVQETLEIMGSIIDGFNVPLKVEHTKLATEVLVPMYKTECIETSHFQLSHCVVTLVEKGPSLFIPVLLELFKFWRITSSQNKDIIYNLITYFSCSVPQSVSCEEFVEPLFQVTSFYLSSEKPQVVRETLLLLTEECIRSVMLKHRDVVLPILSPALSHIERDKNKQNSKLARAALCFIQNVVDIQAPKLDVSTLTCI